MESEQVESARLVIDESWDGQAVDERVVVDVTIGEALTVAFEAPYFGDPPPPGPAGVTPGLWDYEVVELFVAGPGERYLEVELGPHGHSLVLQLDGVRRVVGTSAADRYRAQIEGGVWRGEAVVDAGLLPPRPWRVNAYAIHGVGAGRVYRAAFAVPGARPDFHRLDCFAPWSVVQSGG